eukprot:GHVH01012055.1.p1 GENE.GHVH01012055.1~~GHVH01012055.1.p1  ORF type:complete len:278 (-),score=45.17 GHVH01012055.1:160-993(-)
MTCFQDSQTHEDYILTGSQDGDIYLWKGVSFNEPLFHFPNAEKVAVNSIVAHPQGALALCVNSGELVGRVKKGNLKLLDLEKGVEVMTKVLDSDPLSIVFNPSGDLYAIMYMKHVDVHSLGSEDGTQYRIDEEGAVFSSMTFILDDVLLVGTNRGTMHVLTTRSPSSPSSPKKKQKTNEGGAVNANPDSCKIKCVKIVTYETENNELVRIKGIMRMDDHPTGMVHVVAMTSMGRALFWATDRSDLMSKKRHSDVSDEFSELMNEQVRVSTVICCTLD